MIESKKFRNKITGEIKTQIPIMEINDYEPLEEDDDEVLKPVFKGQKLTEHIGDVDLTEDEEEDITKKPVFKVHCEYYLYADDKTEAIDFIANEDNIVESHFIIEEVNKEDVDEDEIYNHPKFEKEEK